MSDGAAARAEIARVEPVTGWVVVGTAEYLVGFRALVEHPSTLSVSDTAARLFRDLTPEQEARNFDPNYGIERARYHRDLCERDRLLGFGLQYAVYHVDSPACPLVVDWEAYARLRGQPRGRDLHYYRRNVPIVRPASGRPRAPVDYPSIEF